MALSQQQTKHSALWQALTELAFISAFFSWLFLLLSRLAEPFMLLAAMYIIIEAGIPAATNAILHNLSIGVMITAPEVILPGAFVLATQERVHGRQNRGLQTVCWLFVTLTLITLLSLFVFHFDQTVINLIMCARCATGIGYSILIRILTHSNQSQAQLPLQGLQPQSQVTVPEITPAVISRIVEQLQPHVSETIHKELETAVSTLQQTSLTRPVPAEEETKTASNSRPIRKSAGDRQGNREKKPKPAITVPLDNITPIGSGKVSDEQIEAAYQTLKTESADGRVSAETLRVHARISKGRACKWLRNNVQEEVTA